MDALLHALARRDRRRLFALTAASVAVVAAAIAFVALRGERPKAGCEQPARAIEDVWSTQMADALAASGRSEVRDAIDRDVASWRREREVACTAHPEHRAARLACLDGVLARIDVIYRALERVQGKVAADDVLGYAVDPKVCAATVPPRLTVTATHDAIAAFAFAIDAARGRDSEAPQLDAVASLATKPGLDPCSRGYARLAEIALTDDVPREKAAFADALTAAEACGDDRLHAEVLIAGAPLEYEVPVVGPKGRAALEKAKVAVDRVAQPDLVATIDAELSGVLAQEQRWDEAFAAAQRAIAGYGARGRARAQIAAVEAENGVRITRCEVDDVQEIVKVCETWKKVARAHHFARSLERLERTEAFAILFLGDVMGAHAELLRLFKPRSHRDVPTQRIEGMVVDEAGKPIVGAIVAASARLFFDSVGPTPFGDVDASSLRMVTSDVQGKFVIADAPMHGEIAAQLGLRRGYAELGTTTTIVVHDTRNISGKVALGNVSRTKVFVMIVPKDSQSTLAFMAPLSPDGTFLLKAVPKDNVSVAVATWSASFDSDVEFHTIPPGGDVSDLRLAPVSGNGRALDVIARSTFASTLDGAQVILIPGRWSFRNVAELNAAHHSKSLGQMRSRYARPIVGEGVPEEARGKMQQGDLYAHFDDARAGEVTVCVIGMSGDLTDPATWRKIEAHVKELDVKCMTASPSDRVLVVEAPPQKRFD
jgi:hypothetical protein